MNVSPRTLHSFIRVIQLNKVFTKPPEEKSKDTCACFAFAYSFHRGFVPNCTPRPKQRPGVRIGRRRSARLMLRLCVAVWDAAPRAPNVPLRGASIVTSRRSGNSSFVSPYMVIYVTDLFRPPGFNEKKRWSSLGRATQRASSQCTCAISTNIIAPFDSET